MAHNFNFDQPGYIPNNYNFNFYTPVITYDVLAGTSNNFTAIWADPDANLSTGKIYIASSAAFSIIDNTLLVDYYTTTFGGRANETLIQNDIKDINI